MRLSQIIGSDFIFPKVSSGERLQARGQTAPDEVQRLCIFVRVTAAKFDVYTHVTNQIEAGTPPWRRGRLPWLFTITGLQYRKRQDLWRMAFA